MSLELWQGAIKGIRTSAVFRGTVFTGTMLLIIIGALIVLVCVTFLLRLFFKSHPFVNRAHRILIYLLTMTSVLALMLAGVIGILLPVIPGVLFMFIALLLMRRYHRMKWFDRRMGAMARQFRKTSFGKRYYAWRKRVHERRLRRKEERLRREREKIQEKLNKLHEEQHKKR